MIQFNHHHLYYFWVVAREGSIARACEKLFLAQPTVSAQIIQLERFLKKKLFVREKRSLTLTEDGRLVLEYANLIFNYSQELLDALKDRPGKQLLRIQIGITDQVAKTAALSLIRKVMQFPAATHPQVVTGTPETLFQELKNHTLDLVFTHRDVPLEDTLEFVKSQVGLLAVNFVAARKLAQKIHAFPADMVHWPLLLPGRQTAVGAAAEDYFSQQNIVPAKVGEIQDVELLRLLALEGIGVVPLSALGGQDDFRNGRLVKLNRGSTGITQTFWLVAKKRYRMNPIAEAMLKSFRLTK